VGENATLSTEEDFENCKKGRGESLTSPVKRQSREGGGAKKNFGKNKMSTQLTINGQQRGGKKKKKNGAERGGLAERKIHPKGKTLGGNEEGNWHRAIQGEGTKGNRENVSL